MNLLNKDLSRIILLRQYRHKNWITGFLNLNCIHYAIRFWLISIKDQFEWLEYSLSGSIFDQFFNLGQFNRVYFVVGTLCLIVIFNNTYIVYTSDSRVWDPLVKTLTKNNWQQFVADNLPFEISFSWNKLLRNPILSLKKCLLVFQKLRNYRQVHFLQPLKLFPYMNRKIRVKVLSLLLFYTFLLKLIYQSTSILFNC